MWKKIDYFIFYFLFLSLIILLIKVNILMKTKSADHTTLSASNLIMVGLYLIAMPQSSVHLRHRNVLSTNPNSCIICNTTISLRVSAKRIIVISA